MKNILITGIRGFIGFNAVQLWKKEHPECTYVGLDAETYADKFLQGKKDEWLQQNGISTYVVDLGRNDSEHVVESIVLKHKIDTIVNFAAESHVDNSIKNPNVFFHSNVIGTTTMLNVAKKHDIRMHQIGTDEVYGITHPEDNATEDYSLSPSSPYSSSKASADLIALSYFKTFGTKVTVSRCTNNAGPWQMSEKLIPTVISKAMRNEKIPVYGDGMQRRHWIHVDEHNRAIFKILKDGECGKVYNIAPCHANYLANIEIIKAILDCLGKPYDLIEHVADRLGHDTSYYLYSKLFTSEKLFLDDLPKIVEWYKENI